MFPINQYKAEAGWQRPGTDLTSAMASARSVLDLASAMTLARSSTVLDLASALALARS